MRRNNLFEKSVVSLREDQFLHGRARSHIRLQSVKESLALFHECWAWPASNASYTTMSVAERSEGDNPILCRRAGVLADRVRTRCSKEASDWLGTSVTQDWYGGDPKERT